MNTVHPHLRHNLTNSVNGNDNVNDNDNDNVNDSRFDWAGQIKLAIVLSVVAALTTITLAGRVAEPVLIVGVIVVASFAGWARVQPAPQAERQLIRIPVRHR